MDTRLPQNLNLFQEIINTALDIYARQNTTQFYYTMTDQQLPVFLARQKII